MTEVQFKNEPFKNEPFNKAVLKLTSNEGHCMICKGGACIG